MKRDALRLHDACCLMGHVGLISTLGTGTSRTQAALTHHDFEQTCESQIDIKEFEGWLVGAGED